MPPGYKPQEPHVFAAVLTEKLRKVQKERESEDKIQEALRGLQKVCFKQPAQLHRTAKR